MRRQGTISLVSLLLILPLFLTGVPLVCAQEKPKDIQVSELNNSGHIIGLLGKPLGTRIVLVGKAPEHAFMISNPIEVISIDGKLIDKPIQISVLSKKASQPLELSIEKGFQYTLTGYESGGFVNTPTWVAEGAQQPFHFSSFFVPVTVEARKIP
jgi:hypothetical protein